MIDTSITVPPPHVSKNSTNGISVTRNISNGIEYPIVTNMPVINHARELPSSCASPESNRNEESLDTAHALHRIGKMKLVAKTKIDISGHQLPMSMHGMIIMRIPPDRRMELPTIMRMFFLLASIVMIFNSPRNILIIRN